jgi:hypothetical protein
MKRGLLILAALTACHHSSTAKLPVEVASAKNATFELHPTQPPAGYDPFALARAALGHVSNEEAGTPPQCYERADGKANGCASCHTHSTGENFADDWELQQNYSFTDYAKTNHWKNQFRERGDLVAAFTDADVLAHVRQDNYAPLLAWTAAHPDAPGYKPDLDFAKGFDADGFATDGSGWRALRYKPFVGGFWATGGSTDDVFVRLPSAFRTTPMLYRTNLAILEAAITADPKAAVASLVREIEPIDETASGIDLDGDGELGTATKIVGLPSHFTGAAAEVAVVRGLYPAGTEMLHTVRYLDPEKPGFAATRMKEVRYAQKTDFLPERQIAKQYTSLEEHPELPAFTGDAMTGLKNGFSWQLQGYIEDANGWLRKQTDEEHAYCMGCHSNVGITVDQTFAFARKVPGAAGWQKQDPTGIPDVPQVGHQIGEYAEYVEHTGGGAIDAAVARDIGGLINPPAKRAIDLDRAYLANVIEQSYVWGREAITSPAKNVHAKIEERSTGLGEADRVYRDTKLQLDWARR